MARTYYCPKCGNYWSKNEGRVIIWPGFYVDDTDKRLCKWCLYEQNREQRFIEREVWFRSDCILERGKHFAKHCGDTFTQIVEKVTPQGLVYIPRNGKSQKTC